MAEPNVWYDLPTYEQVVELGEAVEKTAFEPSNYMPWKESGGWISSTTLQPISLAYYSTFYKSNDFKTMYIITGRGMIHGLTLRTTSPDVYAKIAIDGYVYDLCDGAISDSDSSAGQVTLPVYTVRGNSSSKYYQGNRVRGCIPFTEYLRVDLYTTNPSIDATSGYKVYWAITGNLLLSEGLSVSNPINITSEEQLNEIETLITAMPENSTEQRFDPPLDIIQTPIYHGLAGSYDYAMLATNETKQIISYNGKGFVRNLSLWVRGVTSIYGVGIILEIDGETYNLYTDSSGYGHSLYTSGMPSYESTTYVRCLLKRIENIMFESNLKVYVINLYSSTQSIQYNYSNNLTWIG